MLRNLFQCLTGFFPLIFNQFSTLQLVSVFIHLLLCISKKSMTILSVTTHCIVKMENLLLCPPFPQVSLLFFTLSKHCCFSISSYILFSTCLTHFNVSLSVLFWTAHNWIQYCSCCLTNHILQLLSCFWTKVQTFTNTAQDAVALLCSRDTLLTCVQVDVHQDSKVYCWKTAFYPVSSQPVHGVTPPQVQELMLVFLELNEISSCPFL